MAMSNAERQKRYRQKTRESGDSRINTTISAGSRACLKRIANHKGVSEREALEVALQDAEAQLIPSTQTKPVTTYNDFRQRVISSGILKTQRAYIRDGYRDRQIRVWFRQLEAEGLTKKEGQAFILTRNTH